MNAILSIKPEYVAEIKAGRKRFEFRKAVFKELVGKVYIYASAPVSMVVVDLNENGPAELVRDVRSTQGLYVPDEFRCYALNFADPIFECIFREEQGFDIVANFSAHKHVRSEKDQWHSLRCLESGTVLLESKDGPYRPLDEDEIMNLEQK